MLDLNGDSDSSEEDEVIGENKPTPVVVKSEVKQEVKEEEDVVEVAPPPPPLSTRYHLLDARVNQDPFDTEAWTGMVMEVHNQPPETMCGVYKRFLEQFPTAGNFLKAYVELEMKQQNWTVVEEIFQKSLLVCPHIDLWKMYLDYIQKVKVDTAGSGEAEQQAARTEMIRAFEFALENIGVSLGSATIWRDYTQYLKDKQVQGDIADPNILRKVYQRAVVTPMHNMEYLWREYEAFEKGMNETLAAHLLTEYQPRYMNARAIYQERRGMYEQLIPNTLACRPTNTPMERAQLVAWRRILAYEKSNPEGVPDDQAAMRVRHCFKQCLCCLRYYPEIWHDFAMYELHETKDAESAYLVLKNATQSMPGCHLLAFTLAEFEEEHKKVAEAKLTYEALIKSNPSALAFIQFQRFSLRTGGEKQARDVFKRARKAGPAVCTYHVWVAAAHLEAYCSKHHDIARTIFGRGMNQFAHEAGYCIEYLDFLLHAKLAGGDDSSDSNIRALFEQVLAALPGGSDQARKIWRRFLDFEYKSSAGGGDIGTVGRLEKRYSEAYPNDNPELRTGLMRSAHRYCVHGLVPASIEDGCYFGRHEAAVELVLGGLGGNNGMAAAAANGAQQQQMLEKQRQQAQVAAAAAAAAATGNSGSKIPKKSAGRANSSASASAAGQEFVPIPQFLLKLARLLPAGENYKGPRPSAEHVMQVCSRSGIGSVAVVILVYHPLSTSCR
jgi:cleavage stimulation factor subunit 3